MVVRIVLNRGRGETKYQPEVGDEVMCWRIGTKEELGKIGCDTDEENDGDKATFWRWKRQERS